MISFYYFCFARCGRSGLLQTIHQGTSRKKKLLRTSYDSYHIIFPNVYKEENYFVLRMNHIILSECEIFIKYNVVLRVSQKMTSGSVRKDYISNRRVGLTNSVGDDPWYNNITDLSVLSAMWWTYHMHVQGTAVEIVR